MHTLGERLFLGSGFGIGCGLSVVSKLEFEVVWVNSAHGKVSQ